jgi:hypothetical protein
VQVYVQHSAAAGSRRPQYTARLQNIITNLDYTAALLRFLETPEQVVTSLVSRQIVSAAADMACSKARNVQFCEFDKKSGRADVQFCEFDKKSGPRYCQATW